MRKSIVLSAILLITSLSFAQIDLHAPWRKLEGGKVKGKVICFATSGNQLVFAATNSGIYVSQNSGRRFDWIIKLPEGVKIGQIAVSGVWLLIDTDKGLYIKMLQQQRMF